MVSLLFKVPISLGNECVNGTEVQCVFNCPVKILQAPIKPISDIKKAVRSNPRTGTRNVSNQRVTGIIACQPQHTVPSSALIPPHTIPARDAELKSYSGPSVIVYLPLPPL